MNSNGKKEEKVTGKRNKFIVIKETNRPSWCGKRRIGSQLYMCISLVTLWKFLGI
jgi:hypothetical protein